MADVPAWAWAWAASGGGLEGEAAATAVLAHFFPSSTPRQNTRHPVYICQQARKLPLRFLALNHAALAHFSQARPTPPPFLRLDGGHSIQISSARWPALAAETSDD